MKRILKICTFILIAVFLLEGVALSGITVNGDEGVPLSVSAESAVLMLCQNGQVIFSKNADTRLPMASTTKIMTAIVAIENSDIDSTVYVHKDAVGIEGSSAYLTEAEKLTMRELLYALMLQSANDAAVAIAYAVGGDIDCFVEMMNVKASSLGLRSTHFENPHGLDAEEHYTTASDLARIASYALENETFREIVSTERYVTSSGKVFVNHNKMLTLYDGAIGVKTGFTKRCGRCLVSAAEREGLIAVAVTLNAPDDWEDHTKMLDYSFSAYEYKTLADDGEIAVELPCVSGDRSTVVCMNLESVRVCLPKGSLITTTIEADRYYPAPAKKGDALATAKFYSEGELIAVVPLFARGDVKEKTGRLPLLDRILRFMGK